MTLVCIFTVKSLDGIFFLLPFRLMTNFAKMVTQQKHRVRTSNAIANNPHLLLEFKCQTWNTIKPTINIYIHIWWSIEDNDRIEWVLASARL